MNGWGAGDEQETVVLATVHPMLPRKLNGFMLFILESKKHKEKNWEENDFYDSDEDTFLDRTGSGW